MKEGHITVNGKAVSLDYKIKQGDIVENNIHRYLWICIGFSVFACIYFIKNTKIQSRSYIECQAFQQYFDPYL